MQTVSRQARALLDFLGIAGGGRSPPAFAEEAILPTLDMFPFLGADSMRIASRQATITAGSEAANLSHTVPDGFLWIVRTIEAGIDLLTNGDRAYVRCAISGLQFADGSLTTAGTAPTGTGTMRFSPPLLQVTNLMVAGFPHAVASQDFTPPLVLLPGMNIVCSISNAIIAADTTYECRALIHQVRMP